ncbi:hypothetical protein WR25_15109 [Diploscapter pachys]|uniref:GAE domain-containing protein n=1 Tax=Diploscapter pachys TaxID=2018661 RepID=A0A2A2LM50_9BILA|nr:hypothetical protein WR25_15109 [Diploscapter pachys]
MYIATERYSPNVEWHLDTMITVLRLAGKYVPDEVVSCMIQLISSNNQLQHYAALQLYRAARLDAINAQPLMQVAFWTMGEFGDLLLQPVDADSARVRSCILFSGTVDRIITLISLHQTSIQLELQHRSVEFTNIMHLGELKFGVLERMPVIAHNSLKAAAASMLDHDTSATPPADNSNLNLLADIDGFGGASANASANGNSTGLNVMDDIMNAIGGDMNISNAQSLGPSIASAGVGGGLDDIFGTGLSTGTGASSQPSQDIFGFGAEPETKPGVIAFNSEGLEVQLRAVEKWHSNSCSLVVTVFNNTPNHMKEFNFLAAVTKAYRIELKDPSGSDLPPHGSQSITQQLNIHRTSSDQPLRIRMRTTFKVNGKESVIQGELTPLPSLD